MYENKIIDKNGNELVKIGDGGCWVIEKEKNELEKIKNKNQELQQKLEKMSEQNKDLKIQIKRIKTLLQLQKYREKNNEK